MRFFIEAKGASSVSVRCEMRSRFIFALLGVALLAPDFVLRGQMDEEQKRQLFLRAREDIRPVPRSTPEATPRPKPKPAATPAPKATPRSTPRAKPTPEEETKSAPVPDDSEDVIDIPLTKPAEEPKATATPRATAAPRATATPKATPTPKPTATPRAPKERPTDTPNAPIIIEKSGLEEDQGFQPALKSSGGWFRRWRYLTPAVRRAIDQAAVKKGRWKYIIIHNSGTRQGNARIFDNYHRRVRKMSNGMAYHFVIGNGSSSGNGQIEIGSRWSRQINGGHVASDYLNNIAIGICLVGDYNRDSVTKAQTEAMEELITYLRGRVGKVKGKPAIVVPHKKINPKPTDCPGDRFPYTWLRQKFG